MPQFPPKNSEASPQGTPARGTPARGTPARGTWRDRVARLLPQRYRREPADSLANEEAAPAGPGEQPSPVPAVVRRHPVLRHPVPAVDLLGAPQRTDYFSTGGYARSRGGRPGPTGAGDDAPTLTAFVAHLAGELAREHGLSAAQGQTVARLAARAIEHGLSTLPWPPELEPSARQAMAEVLQALLQVRVTAVHQPGPGEEIG